MKPWIKISFGLVFFARLALADEPLKSITWDDAVHIALDKNPDLRSSRDSLASTQAKYKGSINGVLPRLNLTNSYTKTKGDNAQTERWRAGGTASIDVFNMSNYASISSSKHAYEGSSANFRLTSSDVYLNLRRAFAGLLYSQQAVDVSKKIRDIRKNNSSLVSLRYDSGRESKGNRMRASAELLEAETNLNQSNRDLIAAQEELKRQLGMVDRGGIAAAGAMDDKLAIGNRPDFDNLVETHPSVALKRAGVLQANAGVAEARSTLWPNLTAAYTRSFNGTDYFPDQPTWTASGLLSLPIFGGGPTAAYYSIAAAKRDREQAMEDLDSMRFQVRSNLEGTWSDFAGSVERVAVQRSFLDATRQRNEEGDIRYSSGLITYDDWEIIVSDRVNFERSVIAAERDAIISQAQWANARGIGLGDQQ